MLAPLSSRNVMITGASKGIGKGMAGVFANKGCKVLLTGRTEVTLKASTEEIQAAGGFARYFIADVDGPEAVQKSFSFAQEVFGGLDILSSNVGIFPSGSTDDIAFAALFFGSSEAGLITGQTLVCRW